MIPLLPAPRIAGLLPAVCPRIAPAKLTAQGQPDYPRLPGPRILVTTAQGTFAVLFEDCIGEALALLAGVGQVELIGRQLELWEAA